MNYSVIIPTYNEEIHLDRVLKQMNFYKIKCFILDSYSNDNTLKIAEKYGVQVVQGKWNDFSEKLNFGIELNPFKTEWMIRLDADEYLDQDFINFLNQNDYKFSLKPEHALHLKFPLAFITLFRC